jgi:hypothetical protein
MLRRILKKVEKLLRLSDGFFLADDGTPEGLLEELLQKERGIKVFQEFGDFLKQTKKKDYLGGFTGLLTELYDCPSTYSKQLSKSYFQILEPFLCLFGATTKAWLVDGMEESDIHGGFLARFLLFPGNEETQLIPITPPRDEQAEQKLAQQLAELYEISGTFEPTEEAKETYAKWYRRHRNELKSPGMGLLSSYYGRLEGYVWKIAFIFEAATNLSLNSVSTDSVKLAIDFVERLKKDLKPLILSDFQPSYWAKTTNKVVRLIRSAGSEGIIRSTLLRSTHLKAKQFTEVLDWLREAGEIRDKPNGTKGTRYCAVTKDESSQHSQAQLRRISL